MTMTALTPGEIFIMYQNAAIIAGVLIVICRMFMK